MGIAADVVGKLFESTTLTLILSGLVIFVLGLNGGLPILAIKLDSPSKQVATSVLGLMVLAGGAVLLVWRETHENRKNDESGRPLKPPTYPAINQMKIDGEYHTSDKHSYRISIIPLPKDSRKDNTGVDYYRIRHSDWNGVGIFDGEFYFTVFQINDKADPLERRGNWGAHVARWHAKTKAFDVLGIELKEKSNFEVFGIELNAQSQSDHLAGRWIWEHDLE
jgi:hypothetical protein